MRGKPFEVGNQFGHGREGAKNRTSRAFREALERTFAEHGENAMKVAWIESPLEMLKIVASLEPRELQADYKIDRYSSTEELRAYVARWLPQALSGPAVIGVLEKPPAIEHIESEHVEARDTIR